MPGAAMPGPAGGRTRQIQIDLDPEALQSKGLSAQDVGNAMAAQTQITPAGFVKIGEYQYNLLLNNAPGSVAELAHLYAAYARDVQDGTQLAPTFLDAVKTHAVIDAIIASDRSGSRVDLSDLAG